MSDDDLELHRPNATPAERKRYERVMRRRAAELKKDMEKAVKSRKRVD